MTRSAATLSIDTSDKVRDGTYFAKNREHECMDVCMYVNVCVRALYAQIQECFVSLSESTAEMYFE